MADPPHPALFTIPPERAFLADLATALLQGDLPRAGGRPPAPLQLADTTVYLPTQRACAELRRALIAKSERGALLLPEIRPLGATDDLPLPAEENPEADIPPAVQEMERWLTLTALVQRWSRARAGLADETGFQPGAAAAAGELALELMALLDSAQLEGVDLSRIDDLVPEDMAEHWQRTSRFLSIVTQQWPEHLRERGLTDPVERRNRLLAREAQRLTARPDAPVIVAGSTGSVPATAALMKKVMSLPAGAIVLPGLDQELDADSWAGLSECPQHPQAGLARLLDALGVSRDQVAVLYGMKTPPRRTLISEVMRPAQTTHQWPRVIANADRAQMAEALEGISLVEARDAREEAEAIAVMMRETLERPGATAALVTPDRILARRVRAALQTWDVDIADSAGEPLSATPLGRFMALVARVAVDADAVSLLALLKHPFVRLGWPAEEIATRVAELEIAAMRQPWFTGGLAGLQPALDRWGRNERAAELVTRLEAAFAPLRALASQPAASPGAYATAHVAAAEALREEPASLSLWQDAAGQAMAALLDSLINIAPGGLAPEIAFSDYPAFFCDLAHRRAIYRDTAHPRLFIWGPLEARLQHADRLILGNLNEGVWPRTAQTGPWLNRTMRAALGLPEPERQAGLSAHDFAQGLAAPEVILTRALKAEETPTVASRWISRLRLLAGAMGLSDHLKPAQPWLAWTAARNPATKASAAPRPPDPCPPVGARPRRMSVSDVERWIANPYAIYAKHILRLEPVPGLAEGPDERHRGQIIHTALARFAEQFPVGLPDEPASALMGIADELMSEWGAFAYVRAFWRPRFARFAAWFADTEPKRRAGLRRSFSEVPGRLMLDAPGGGFELTARADRVDIRDDNALAIYDYKTGSVDARRRAAERLQSPQLPLEGLIALSGGFDLPGLSDAPALAGLAYISAAGGGDAADEQALSSPEMLAEAARDKLAALIARFDDPNTPYRAMQRPAFEAVWAYDAYAHLARVSEWRGGEGA